VEPVGALTAGGRWARLLGAVSLLAVPLLGSGTPHAAGATAALSAGSSSPAPSPVDKAPSPVDKVSTAEEVIRALGIADPPVDYLFLLDVSLSMEDGHRFPDAMRILRQIVGAVRPQDRVSVVTFGEKATIAVERKPKREALSILEDTMHSLNPGSDRSDIGQGFDQGLRVLESWSDFATGAVVLLSDGALDAPRSRFADLRANARDWEALRKRASELKHGKHRKPGDVARSLQGFTFALQPSDDPSGPLQAVLPGASQYWPKRPTEVADHLTQVHRDHLLAAAREVLGSNPIPTVTAEWPRVSEISSLGSPFETQLVLSAPASRVPLRLAGLQVEVDGAAADVRLGRTVADLTPQNGDVTSVPVTVTLKEGPGRPTMVPCRLSVRAGVDSPWTEGIRQLNGPGVDLLGVDRSTLIRCKQGSTTYWMPVKILAGVALCLCLCVCWLFWRHPRFRCELDWTWRGEKKTKPVEGRRPLLRAGGPVEAFWIRGRRTGWGNVTALEIAQVKLVRWGPWRRRRPGTEWGRGAPGEAIHLGDVVFTYRWLERAQASGAGKQGLATGDQQKADIGDLGPGAEGGVQHEGAELVQTDMGRAGAGIV
jgi:hypothetical protein